MLLIALAACLVVVVIQIRRHHHHHRHHQLPVSAVFRGRYIRPPVTNTWNSTRVCCTKQIQRRS